MNDPSLPQPSVPPPTSESSSPVGGIPVQKGPEDVVPPPPPWVQENPTPTVFPQEPESTPAVPEGQIPENPVPFPFPTPSGLETVPSPGTETTGSLPPSEPAVGLPEVVPVETETTPSLVSLPPPLPPSETPTRPANPPSSFSTSSIASAAGNGGLIKKLLPIVGGVVALVAILLVVFKLVLPMIQGGLGGKGEEAGQGQKKTPKAKIALTYWGLWEPSQALTQTIADYQKNHPEVSIEYSQQSPKDYRERLQSALAAGNGPDIFRFHNTWIPMLKTELDTAPKGSINLQEYFPVVAKDLQSGTEILGMPLMFDGLALFYNPRLFTEAGKAIPATWEELRKTAIDMTVYDSKGNIQRAGIALGTTNNVDNFSDILGLMLLQNGADPAKPSGQLVEDALKFYTLFVTTDRVWNETLPASTYAFATEKAAMMLAPSWRAFEIKEINPQLTFKTAPVPQLPGTNIAWASYWVEGVSRRSKDTKAAWEFLQYLSSNETLTKLYTAQSSLRLFGEIYPKKSLAATLESDPVAGAYAKQGEIATSWYLASRTFDNGINDKIIKYYEDAINALLAGKSVTEALPPVATGVSQVLSQYGVSGK